MQAIAREFGFSETTFVLPPDAPDATARVRIFTPLEEIPFAGHPNIGTAFAVSTYETASGPAQGDHMLFEELGGPVEVRLLVENDAAVGAEITAPQPLDVLGEVEAPLVAQCLGLAPDRVLTGTLPPCVASVGLPFAFAELADLDALASISCDIAAFADARDKGPQTVDGFAICAFVQARPEGDRLDLRTRVFSPLGHPLEDPATGSASGALGALLCRATGHKNFFMHQGVEMGRPSEIFVTLSQADRPPDIRGHCAAVSLGTLLT